MRGELINGEIYHLVNHGVENRIVFRTKRDYERFLLTIFECNSINSTERNRYRRMQDKREVANTFQDNSLVEIFVLSLIPDHFHLMAKQLVDGGIAKFMQRLCGSYAKYFNIKNNRKGSLFMSRYKSVHVKTDSQFRHLITYIHANPLDIVMPEWRTGKIKNLKKAKEFLENYKWFSYPLYAKGEGEDLISRIITKEMVESFYPKKEDHFSAIYSWSNRYYEKPDFEFE